MAQYKVPQDVEAEDKFVGPLTFKQFLFGMATIITGYLSFLIITSPLPWLAILFAPFFLVSLTFTIPWSKDQPSDIFLASRIRFLFMKRKRIWDQSGIKDLVTITVPKREVHVYTDGLTQDQVRSRFSALSNVIDSRGWAVKNAQGPSALPNAATTPDESDRLVAPTQTQVTPEEMDMKRTPDILEERSGEMDAMIKKSEDEHRKEALDMVANARVKSKQMNKSVLKEDEQGAPGSVDTLTGGISLPPVDPQHAAMKNTAQPAAPPKPVKKKSSLTKAEEREMLDNLHKKQDIEKKLRKSSHMKTISPLGQGSQSDDTSQSSTSATNDDQTDDQTASATPVNPAILTAANNNDRSVESLAREVNHEDPDDGEVVVSLH